MLIAVLGIKAQSPLALTIDDFDIKAGETKTVHVAMQNKGYDVIAIEFKMELPEGLSLKGRPTLVNERIGSGEDDFGDVVQSSKTVNASKSAAGYWIFSIFSMTDQFPFDGTDGNVIDMNIAADANMPIGETSIRLYDIELSTKDAPYYPEAYSNKVLIYHENVNITMAHDKQTFSCQQPLDFTNTGLKAYIATDYQEGETGIATLTRVEQVPAKTGLFIVGTENETYTVPYTDFSEPFSNNLLKPVLMAQVVPQTDGEYTNYLYGEVNGEVGFHLSSGKGAVAAGKAYLQLPSSAVGGTRSVSIVFDGEVTGIYSIENSDSTPVYDVSGRKIANSALSNSQLKKGVYIVGGKKTVVKK